MVVLDASVWVASLLSDEPHHLASDRWIHDWSSAGNFMIVPRLFLVEVGSAVARRRGSPSEGEEAVRDVRLQSTVDIHDLDRRGWDSAAQLAPQLLLRSADAAYVALALQEGLPLVTWDREILDRATDVVDVRTPDQLPV